MFEQQCVARGLVQKTLTLSKYIGNDAVEYKDVFIISFFFFFFKFICV